MDLLTTYINHSELQVITAQLLISTIHRSSQHPLRLFPACRIFNSRSLATSSNNGNSSASHVHVVTVMLISRNWIHSAGLGSSLYCRADSTENSLQQSLYCCYGRLPSDSPDIVSAGICLPSRCSETAVCLSVCLHSNDCIRCPFRGLCSATGLYATLHIPSDMTSLLWMHKLVHLITQN
jgi:hypothetical protein